MEEIPNVDIKLGYILGLINVEIQRGRPYEEVEGRINQVEFLISSVKNERTRHSLREVATPTLDLISSHYNIQI